jgi:signal transduction histidine kinase
VFFERLYIRIWLAVVLAVAVLTLMVGYAWRMTAEPPLREVVVRNAAGEIIGTGRVRFGRPPGASGWHVGEVPAIAPAAGASSPAPGAAVGTAPNGEDDDNTDALPRGRFGAGPEATVRMLDGQTMHMHMPRPSNGNWHAPFGFFWTLGLVAIAVALAIYPIVRRLTRRLESLQRDVERWGNGDLSVRMPLAGDDEVGFLAKRFNHAAEQIQTLMKAREDLLASQKSLLANASHELRSPLTRIRMGIELMGGAPGSAAKEEITRNINELDQLVGEILLASRLEAKEADLGTVEEVDLVGICAEECARVNATLDVEVASVSVPGVAKLLRRVVRNLLENAKRYGGDDINVSIRQSETHAILQVNDRGPGVPQELSERIFEPFYRLPGASEREGGVGLGLSLVKQIALRHNGSIQCSNRDGGGACFEVRLPV